MVSGNLNVEEINAWTQANLVARHAYLADRETTEGRCSLGCGGKRDWPHRICSRCRKRRSVRR